MSATISPGDYVIFRHGVGKDCQFFGAVVNAANVHNIRRQKIKFKEIIGLKYGALIEVHIPMGRFGEAKEMAQAALFLASNASSYMTGNEFLVDGGISAAYVTPE